MKTFLPLLFLLAAWLLANAPAFALDESGSYTSLGLGGERCTRYAAIVGRPARGSNRSNALLFKAWIGGHLSGLNSWVQGAPDFLGKMSLDQAMQALLRWCRAHPKAKLDDAVIAFESELVRRTRPQLPTAPTL